ncbi:hypothetical protein GXP67_11570 [Rhodocytophaga rosea]|uniref:Uncharacterized protein n=1 Tax=Rhodocytophaga rosea TaxID=2704465 RepID=A0A6C0GGR9_9BACT|nr:hypothetical protein [Rhodocytophaga rosea]QHT67231.1 hypothetical protein GXP67_11570 [Rhodocytophaga rosea]
MKEKNHLDLVQECLMQEKYLQVEQSLSIGLRTFADLIQSKSKPSLLNIKLFLLDTMHQNDDNITIVNLCQKMIEMVEEKVDKLEQ